MWICEQRDKAGLYDDDMKVVYLGSLKDTAEIVFTMYREDMKTRGLTPYVSDSMHDCSGIQNAVERNFGDSLRDVEFNSLSRKDLKDLVVGYNWKKEFDYGEAMSKRAKARLFSLYGYDDKPLIEHTYHFEDTMSPIDGYYSVLIRISTPKGMFDITNICSRKPYSREQVLALFEALHPVAFLGEP